ncbi:MAG TPA: methionyl-tRNA formyltransferase [Candidatus Avipropionibacterium avicola]|uniref:Methionyl-tRNA formyltransferase n=1 Tax=Candidatus Avipropionibacterium avicola TaxID=2840701 RepID=A0A9D1GXS8_9ACTN|nr:methionyl-tRNA formyltransferase [Candidatus Avipropionibacterium avicola]
MRVVFAGTPEVAVPSLNALVESDHEVIAVVTRPDAPAGRGRRLVPSPVGARAEELGLEVLKPERPSEADFVARLGELAPDCCPVVAYGALVPQRVIDLATHGWVNLHFSLLPRWRGAAPVQHAVIAGDTQTGACTFSLVKAMDAGPVYDRIQTPIEAGTTAGDLLSELAVDGAGLLVRTLDAIAAGTAVATPQPEDGVTMAPKLTVEDARLDFTRTATELDRQIRGCTPAPGAWALFRGERFKVITAAPSEGQAPAGQLVVSKKSVHVGTGEGLLELVQIQPPGKKAMRAADWARGVQFEAAESLT